MIESKQIHIFGGGTLQHVRAHLALAAPAFGGTAAKLGSLFKNHESNKMSIKIHLTKMADSSSDLVTNEDVETKVNELISDFNTKIIVFSTAMCDFHGMIDNHQSGKYSDRLKSNKTQTIVLTPTEKVINRIRKHRKDIFLVGFKTTTGASEEEQFREGLTLMKNSSCNLVVANDLVTRMNMIITPEEARYAVSTDREYVLKELVDMCLLRSHLSFTRSTVVDGFPVPWNSSKVPESLRSIVNHCIAQDAYKQGPTGATVGHFACKIGDGKFLTSRRKCNFNEMENVGLVEVHTDGDDSVIAYGSKPSVGGQSQRILFATHSDADCVVHFHCPLKDGNTEIPVVSQREYECGSHECGQNTANGIKWFGEIGCVMLDKHGPNIIFNHNIDPQLVIKFIGDNFDLSRKTT